MCLRTGTSIPQIGVFGNRTLYASFIRTAKAGGFRPGVSMTNHASRVDQLARIVRQISQVGFQREVYIRHEKTEQVIAADAALWTLRLDWLATHYAAWQRAQKRAGG